MKLHARNVRVVRLDADGQPTGKCYPAGPATIDTTPIAEAVEHVPSLRPGRVQLTFTVPEQVSWHLAELLCGADLVRDWRAADEALSTWESEGGSTL